jgi:hypothetical protein
VGIFGRINRWASTPTRQGIVTAVAFLGLSVALLLASGCAVGGEDRPASEKPRATPTRRLDRPGTEACNTFARWLASDEDPATRQAVAIKVDKQASTSKSGQIAAKAEILAKSTVIASNENWALAADAFAYECQHLGWTAADAR